MKTLYLCYFGLLEPLVQTQVLPYLRGLSAGGIEVHLLTFEPQLRRRWSHHLSGSLKATGRETRSAFGDRQVVGWTPALRAEWTARLAADGIRWSCRAYHKRPSALVTPYDIVVGAWTAARQVRRERIDVLHARSHVPMAMALLAQRFARCRVVFDFRGFLADEYAAAGTWTERSVAYRAVKWVERVGLSRADHIVVLTHRARQWLIEQRLAGADKIEVIPCCVDVSRFQDGRPLASASAVEPFEVVYAGSVSGLYLLQEMGRFFIALRHRQPNAVFRVLIPHGSVEEVSRILEGVGLGPRDCWIGTVDATDVPQALRRARLGLSFRRPTFAQLAACPTKIPEYLAMGIPVACTAGVGDMDELLAREQVGVLIPRLDAEAYAQAASEALALTQDAAVSDRCRRVARERFDLQRIGGARYRAVYDRLRTRTSRPPTRVLFLVPYPEGCAPSQRLKFEQYYPSFEEQGIEVVVSPFMVRALWRILYQRGRLMQKIFYTLLGYGRRVIDLCRAKRFDAVYIHLWALPLGPPWFEELLARRGVPIIYDIDDLIYLPRASQANAFMRRFRKEERIARIMQVARHVIVCTEYLRQVALRHNSAVTTIPSTINTAIYSPRRHSSATRAVTIGWSGSHSTAPYLRLIAPALTRVAQRFDIRLLVVGAPDFRLDGIRVETRPWCAERETADLAEMDIGVYPLPHEEWVLGKSGLKALQYMGMGIPVVASAIGAAMEFIVDGENGFLARDLDEWEARVAQLIQQPALRVRLGAAGRATVEQHFSVAGAVPVYLKVLASVLGVSFGAAAGSAGEQPALSLAEPVLERF